MRHTNYLPALAINDAWLFIKKKKKTIKQNTKDKAAPILQILKQIEYIHLEKIQFENTAQKNNLYNINRIEKNVE